MAEAATLSITTGATAQSVFPANPGRKALIFSNTSDTAMYVRFGATAVTLVGMACAANGGGFVLDGEACPKGSISVMCATTGKTFYAWEQI